MVAEREQLLMRMLAIVDLRAPDRPMKPDPRPQVFERDTFGLPIDSGCQAMLLARRNGNAIMPAPTVRLV